MTQCATCWREALTNGARCDTCTKGEGLNAPHKPWDGSHPPPEERKALMTNSNPYRDRIMARCNETLNDFHRVNFERQHEAFAPAHSLMALVVCVQKEVGELAAAVLGFTGEKKRKAHLTRNDVLDAVADAMTYLSLVASNVGCADLEALLGDTFNMVSDRAGSRLRTRLGEKEIHGGAVPSDPVAPAAPVERPIVVGSTWRRDNGHRTTEVAIEDARSGKVDFVELPKRQVRHVESESEFRRRCEWLSDPPAAPPQQPAEQSIIRAAEGVVLETGEYYIVEVDDTDPRLKAGSIARPEKCEAARRLASHYNGTYAWLFIDGGPSTWVTAVRRVEAKADRCPNCYSGNRQRAEGCENPFHADNHSPRPEPVCSTCGDTHQMWLGEEGEERKVPCTRCPSPCPNCVQRSAGGVRGAYCAKAQCRCLCHGAKAQPEPSRIIRSGDLEVGKRYRILAVLQGDDNLQQHVAGDIVTCVETNGIAQPTGDTIDPSPNGLTRCWIASHGDAPSQEPSPVDAGEAAWAARCATCSGSRTITCTLCRGDWDGDRMSCMGCNKGKERGPKCGLNRWNKPEFLAGFAAGRASAKAEQAPLQDEPLQPTNRELIAMVRKGLDPQQCGDWALGSDALTEIEKRIGGDRG